MYTVYPSNLLIYCINLHHRTDRKKHTQSEFKKIGISPDNVIYPYFVKDKRGGGYGCFDSHMKCWNDFYYNHAEEQYCLVFEDDFVAQPQAKELLEKARKYVNKNIEEIDLLLLHHICVPVDNNLNNEDFTNGYGFLTQAYIVTRPYIQGILKKTENKLPESNGYQIDFLINSVPTHLLYSEKIFYTKQQCFMQLLDKSDNYINKVDELFRKDITKRTQYIITIAIFLREKRFINDNGIKRFYRFINKIINI